MLKTVKKMGSAIGDKVGATLHKWFGEENLFTRNDTIFGVCEGLGQDLGINPLYLRLAFILPLFWFPVQLVATYLALGGVVFVSRMVAPERKVEAGGEEAQVLTKPDSDDQQALAEAA